MSYNDTTIELIIPSLLALTIYSWQHILGNLSLSWCLVNSLRSFDLSIGDAPEESAMISMISNARVSLDDSPWLHLWCSMILNHTPLVFIGKKQHMIILTESKLQQSSISFLPHGLWKLSQLTFIYLLNFHQCSKLMHCLL